MEFVPTAHQHILASFLDTAATHGIDVRRDRQGVLYEAVLLNSALERYTSIRDQQRVIAQRMLLSTRIAPTPEGIDAFLADEGGLLLLLRGRDLYGFLANGIVLGVGGAYPATPPHEFCRITEAPQALELRAGRWVRALYDLSLTREAAFLASRPAIQVLDEYLDVALGREAIMRDPLTFLQCMRTVV